MDSAQAIWITEMLCNYEKISFIDWRVLKKYADDWEENQQVKP